MVNKKNNNNVFLLLFLCCWSRNTIVNIFLLLFGKIPIIGGYNYVFYSIFICFLGIKCLPIYIKLKKRDFIMVGIMFFSALTGLIGGNLQYFSNGILGLFFEVFSFYFLGRFCTMNSKFRCCGKNFELSDVLYILSAVGIIVTFIMQLYAISTGSYNSVYENSAAATNTKFLVGYCCFYMFNKKKLHAFIVSIFGICTMISYGNRASILATALMFAISFMICFKGKKGLDYFIKILLFAIALIVLIQFDYIISWLYSIFKYLGLNTRILNLLTVKEGLTNSNGRDAIYSTAIKMIKEKPLCGYGIFGDRPFFEGFYVHNIVLEFFIDYGIIIGGILLALLIVVIIIGISRHKGQPDELAFFLVLVVSEFTMLMFSGSYLQEGFFFMMLGYALTPSCGVNISEKIKCQTKIKT